MRSNYSIHEAKDKFVKNRSNEWKRRHVIGNTDGGKKETTEEENREPGRSEQGTRLMPL